MKRNNPAWRLGDRILEKLKKALMIREEEFAALSVSRDKKEFFKILVTVILSQNTNETNTWRAYNRLKERIGVTPQALLEAPIQLVEEAIKPAGLQRSKGRALKSVARIFMKHKPSELTSELKEELLRVKGVGYKTIDVVAAMLGEPVLPIDTHIRRVSRRLGIGGGGYKNLQQALHKLFRPERRLEAHLYLIAFGRRICRARNPLCDNCPLGEMCEYRMMRGGRPTGEE